MASGGNISEILAALSGQGGVSNSPNPGQQHPHPHAHPPAPGQPPPGMPPTYLNPYGSPHPPGSTFTLPVPKSSGAIDLSGVRPSNSGSYNMPGSGTTDASRRGTGYDSGRDSRGGGRRHTRSRSRSPQRFDDHRDNRRDDRRYGRDRSNSPRRDSHSGSESGHEVLSIESNLVGLIIGQQGKNLRRVEQETQARVQFLTGPESSGPTRQCKISGPFKAREAAKAEIRRIISENGNPVRGGLAADNRDRSSRPQSQQQKSTPSNANSNSNANEEDAFQMMVPNRTVGLIIGRGGETIKDLQERSGCHVNILSEEHTVNGLRPVNLLGPPHCQQVAKDLILEVVDSDDKNMPPGGSGGRSGNNQPVLSQGNDPSKIEDTMFVPSDAVGMIIGKGGEAIKDMQNKSGCKINVSSPSGRDIQREIGLIGSRSAIETAKALIMDKVRAAEEKTRARRGEGNYDSYSQNPPAQHPQPSYTNYSGYGQSGHGGYQQPHGQGQQSSEDPYAAYGGYDNYVKLWYAAAAQQQQHGQPSQQQPGGALPQ